MAPVLFYFVRSLKRSAAKDSLSPSATRNTESNVATSSTCWRRPLQKGFLSTGKLTDTATGIVIDEKQLISWARMIGQKNEEDRTCQFRSWSSKSQEAKMMHDLLQPTEIALRQSSSFAHLYLCLDRGSKPGSTVKISFSLLDFYSSTSLLRSWSTTQLATLGAAPKSIGREVEKKCPVGASKHGRSG